MLCHTILCHTMQDVITVQPLSNRSPHPPFFPLSSSPVPRVFLLFSQGVCSEQIRSYVHHDARLNRTGRRCFVYPVDFSCCLHYTLLFSSIFYSFLFILHPQPFFLPHFLLHSIYTKTLVITYINATLISAARDLVSS